MLENDKVGNSRPMHESIPLQGRMVADDERRVQVLQGQRGFKEAGLREIKFRAWFPDCDTGRQYAIYFSLSDISQGSVMGPDSEWHSLSSATSIEQYTGLKDKNGKEIFEGDILSHRYYARPVVCSWNQISAYFQFEDIGTCDQSLEVVGNIHENGELLK